MGLHIKEIFIQSDGWSNNYESLLDQIVNMFLDDILVLLKKKQEHKQHLRMVLQTLRENQLYANFSKY